MFLSWYIAPFLILNAALAILLVINSSADEHGESVQSSGKMPQQGFPLECITELLSQTKANRGRQIEVVTQEKQMRGKEDEKALGVPSCCFNIVLQKMREIGRGG